MIATRTSERGLAARRSVEMTLQRIEMLVDRETEALRARAVIDLRDSNNAKSQALLELELAARTLEGIPLDLDLIERIKALRTKLENNRAVLGRHLEAVREVANLIADAIRDFDWDGTYSQYIASGGANR